MTTDITDIAQGINELGHHSTITPFFVAVRHGKRNEDLFFGTHEEARQWIKAQEQERTERHYFRLAIVLATIGMLILIAAMRIDNKADSLLVGMPGAFCIMFAYLNAATYWRERTENAPVVAPATLEPESTSDVVAG